MRALGNRRQLPAGPLREPVSRLVFADAVVALVPTSGGKPLAFPAAYTMTLVGDTFVRVDEPLTKFGEVADRRQATVDIRARAPVCRDDTRHHELLVADHEAPFHACLGGAGTNHGRIGTATDQQTDRLHQHGLARAGLAGESSETATQHEVEPLDHAQRFDVEFLQHLPVRQPELRLQDLVESPFAEAYEPGHLLCRSD